MVQNLTDATFGELIKETPKVVVKYYADWCGSCRLFAPKFRRMSEDPANAGVKFLEVNAEENPEARKMGGVSNLPFIAVFKDGERVTGEATSKEEFVQQLIASLGA